MLFLSKSLPVLLYPLGLAILLMAASQLFRKRFGRFLTIAALLVLWVTSAPVFANWLTASLEGRYPPMPVEKLPTADAVIVLGGVLGQPLPPRIEPDFGDPVDRVIDAWRIFRSGKAKTIVVSGGGLPWMAAVKPEAALVKAFLVELGVPQASIITEPASRNTHENAINTAKIIRAQDWRSVVLVTSAAHMPRALAAFAKAGVNALPAPTDFHARYPLADSILDFLPDAGALAKTTSAIKEYIGLMYYRVRGWS